jgi:plasmid stabilization system protein ParE
MKVIWSPLSIDRVQEISEYISNDSPGEALKWVDEIFNFVLNLEKFPELGRHVPEIKKTNYREIIFGNYRIVYRIDEKQVYILTVRHFKQILPISELKNKKKKI